MQVCEIHYGKDWDLQIESTILVYYDQVNEYLL